MHCVIVSLKQLFGRLHLRIINIFSRNDRLPNFLKETKYKSVR